MPQSQERLVNESQESNTKVCVGITYTPCLISGYDPSCSVALVKGLELCDPQALSPRQWTFCLPQKETKGIKQVDMCTALPTDSSVAFSLLQSRPTLTSRMASILMGLRPSSFIL